jgi:hypothetical protein
MKSIKDLIYFDSEKANSLLSQLSGGLISEISNAVEDETEESSDIGFDLKFLKAGVGDKSKERSIRTEKRSLYHAILDKIEIELEKHNLLTSINESFDNSEGSFKEFMSEVPKFSYIKANGWGSFEDFDRFKRILANFNDIQRLVFAAQLTDDPEILKIKEQLEDARKAVNADSDSNQKAKKIAVLLSAQKKLDAAIKKETDIHFFDEDWIEKVKVLLDTFSPDRLNFRLLPFEDFSNFQILANLKGENMLDGAFENTIFTYGSRPNVKLTVMGIITSCPQKVDARVNPNDEFIDAEDEELSDTAPFERAFRNVFGSFEFFEEVFFVPYYPKIAISPIAIYREVFIEAD